MVKFRRKALENVRTRLNASESVKSRRKALKRVESVKARQKASKTVKLGEFWVSMVNILDGG